ncbi:MAG: hypothetical protein A4E64_02440 [Syntrophorhabdus sp. PtaU1.Bin058]|nr:MAG: hypothetical protein A4E64_02440 [Syntrophorhabdus sp. PtaU1.Bin058]
MRKLSLISLVIGLFILFCPDMSGAAEAATTTVDDQTAVEVTIYNSNIGLVKDTRDVRLARGIQELRFMDVASQIITTSVNIRSISSPEGLIVLEQNYEYDLLSPRKLIDKYVGKTVKLATKNPYTDKEEIITATILSNNEGTPVYRINNEITFGHPGRIIFPEIPGNLIAKPTLIWLLDNKAGSRQKTETLYLTRGINWRADYVLILDRKDVMGDLNGWVTIDNKSGTAYKNAGLKLVAGDIHRTQDDDLRKEKLMAAAVAKRAEPEFKEAAFFEYHIYTLERKTTIKENQTKQISLLGASNVPLKKEFIYRGAPSYYRSRYGDAITNDKVGVFLEIHNKKENNLGMPLPKGIIRVYKEDQDKSLQFVGEDSIDHTPKDEKVRIRIGNAFDIAATRKQTAWEKISKDTYEIAFEISLRNHKTEDVTIKVVEPLSWDWKIIESSYPYMKVDAHTASFDVPVKKDGEAKLTYRARLRF